MTTKGGMAIAPAEGIETVVPVTGLPTGIGIGPGTGLPVHMDAAAREPALTTGVDLAQETAMVVLKAQKGVGPEAQ